MERLVQTHHFGPHRLDVMEHVDEEGASYLVVVDGAVVTDPALETAPRLEDLVRIYARWKEEA